MWREYQHDRVLRSLRRAGEDARVPASIARMLKPPADRPAGRRGLRSPLAGICCLGAFWAALNFKIVEYGGPVFYDGDALTVHYRLDGAGWGPWAFPIACVALLTAAALLWLARTPFGLMAGMALLAGGFGGIVAAIAERNHSGRVTGVELRSLEAGAERDTVTDRLGVPAGHGHTDLRGERLDCLMFVNTTVPWEGQRHVALCFRDGRLLFRRPA